MDTNNTQPVLKWLCPNCSQSLRAVNKSWVCQQGHCFDIAKQGYVNLLQVQDKRSKQPGDSKVMIQSRRKFLEQGYYDPLLRKLHQVIQAVQALAVTENNPDWLDMGCGEGYYVGKLKAMTPNWSWYGLDISKEAIKMAAKQYPVQFIVASSRQVPALDASFDGIYNLFSPFKTEQLLRLLKAQGTWIRVSPGPSHLKEIKSALYSQPVLHKVPTTPEGFAEIDTEQLQFEIQLNDDNQFFDLIQMTPFGWTGDKQLKQALNYDEKYNITCDFLIQSYKKSR